MAYNIDGLIQVLRGFDKFRKKKVIVFGTGEGGKTISELLRLLSIKIAYFVDNDTRKQGMEFMNCRILSPEILINENSDDIFILVASMYYLDIKEQLDRLGFKEEANYCNILSYSEDRHFESEITAKILESPEFEVILKNIDMGLDFKEILSGSKPDWSNRIAEYAYIIHWLSNNHPKKILDVGGKLNNRVIDNYIPWQSELHFLSPSVKQVSRYKSALYLSSIEEFDTAIRYDAIVFYIDNYVAGLRNSRYSRESIYDIYTDRKDDESLCRIVEKLLYYVNDNGNLIICAPYGLEHQSNIVLPQCISYRQIEKLSILLEGKSNITYKYDFINKSTDEFEYADLPKDNGTVFINIKTISS